MKAVVFERYGGPDVLELQDIPVPEVGDDGVLVRVGAAALNPYDWHFMIGLPYFIRVQLGLRRPTRINGVGSDLAGRVEAVGPKVTRFRPGDEVYGRVDALPGRGVMELGSAAEFVRVSEDSIRPRPAGLTAEQAAAVPLAGTTALWAMRDVEPVRSGQHVLVNGASGGVGTFAVQIAHATGATVTGVCSGAKADLVRSLGADHVIDHTSEDFAAAGDRRYDLVFDIGGNSSLRRLRRVLRKDGTLVLVGGESAGGKLLAGFDRQLRAVALSPFVSQRLKMFVAGEDHERLEQLASMVEQGTLRPAVGATYALADAPQAMRDLAEGRARGKLVVTI